MASSVCHLPVTGSILSTSERVYVPPVFGRETHMIAVERSDSAMVEMVLYVITLLYGILSMVLFVRITELSLQGSQFTKVYRCTSLQICLYFSLGTCSWYACRDIVAYCLYQVFNVPNDGGALLMGDDVSRGGWTRLACWWLVVVCLVVCLSLLEHNTYTAALRSFLVRTLCLLIIVSAVLFPVLLMWFYISNKRGRNGETGGDDVPPTPQIVSRLYVRYWAGDDEDGVVCPACQSRLVHSTEAITSKHLKISNKVESSSVGASCGMDDIQLYPVELTCSMYTTNTTVLVVEPTSTTPRTSTDSATSCTSASINIGGSKTSPDHATSKASTDSAASRCRDTQVQLYSSKEHIVVHNVTHANSSTTYSAGVMMSSAALHTPSLNLHNTEPIHHPTVHVLEDLPYHIKSRGLDPLDTCVTACGHCFHFDCLRRSLVMNGSCPLCRSETQMQHCYVVPKVVTNTSLIL